MILSIAQAKLEKFLNKVLIAAITPYFLERENLWFEKNLKKILKARITQSFWKDNILFLEKNQGILVSHFLRKLDELGYEKVFKIEEPGEFSHRGGIVEVFPINLNYGIQFEFLGNRIENILRLPIAIENEKVTKEILKKKLKSQKIFSDLRGVKQGDYLVHLDHGIGAYNQQSTIDNQRYYQLEYAAGDKLYVPAGLERKLSRYIGFSEPKILRLGSPLWQRIKRKTRKEAEKLARELLEIYSKREIAKRSPYTPKNLIYSEIEASFEYEETPDQIKVFADIEKDFKKTSPMDRIICGDVGFGKTEVALRTMIRAVNAGYQAALLCPTTILANQHFQNFKERLKKLPIKVALLSRLQTKREQRKIIEDLKKNKIDVLIGTHRILSKDVEFKNLGLLIIDDEHRFGVKQKEILKKMRATLDILSLTATPIPRTLYLALSSLREISLIQTPPPGRLSIKTHILPFSEKVIKKAIKEEMKRGGQVYYLHNRVETIEATKRFLKNLSPEVNFGIAHGRMKEKELIKVMSDFQKGKVDVLIATTIIEAGLDFPNVNTLIVEDASRLGLAELYQIRGRVGRSYKKAFAFFFFAENLTERARERLKALKEAEALGSGFQIALRDLEIRGAGNILGKEQSGNINAVGLNLYCQMISQAIEKMKMETKPH